MADTFSEHIFSKCRHILGEETWGRVMTALEPTVHPEHFPDALDALKAKLGLPDYLTDFSRLEWNCHQVASAPATAVDASNEFQINPTLTLVPTSWKNLEGLYEDPKNSNKPFLSESCPIHIMIWRHPATDAFHIREAMDADLLALKIVLEDISCKDAAEAGNVSIGFMRNALQRAASQGILVAPASRIRRSPEMFTGFSGTVDSYVAADTFTLQWHITQKCDLHCRHCYDRSDRNPMPYHSAIAVLDGLYDFCKRMNVGGQVSFTGGNPLLYPHFMEVYREAADRGLKVAILGNPTSREKMEKLVSIEKPQYYQISLEGLEKHNDYIRGAGHYQRSMSFLKLLREMDIYSMVMLTLSRDNLDQVLLLGEQLEGRTDFFTFNRLSSVGEAQDLFMPEKEAFMSFLQEYECKASDSSVLGIKDNLINIVRKENDRSLFGGCTGYGCGAAFNFVSLLSDGEVHACRKFPSLIGNLKRSSLYDVYHSRLAQQYRSGGEACRGCELRPVCRGCMAVTYSYGLDVFKDMDPYCFFRR